MKIKIFVSFDEKDLEEKVNLFLKDGWAISDVQYMTTYNTTRGCLILSVMIRYT